MDLFHRLAVARIAAVSLLFFTGAIALLWTSPVSAYQFQYDRDYLLPVQAKGGYISRSFSIESSTRSVAKTAAVATYKAFDGRTHQLLENRGRYVNVLIPQTYEGSPFFTADHIEEMVDRLDMLYVLYSELMGGQPDGSGLLTIAFVPQTCGMGCGLVGAKGFEILSDARNYEAIIRELDAGRLEKVLLHEMAHNFDKYAAFLHYLPDHAHAWTDMFEFFAPFRYARVSSHGQAPDDLYHSPVSSVWKEYVTADNASWQNCVEQDGCGALGLSANNLWAMLYYRIEALHGINVILDSFDFLQEYTRLAKPPASDLEKEGVRILSLAKGAGVNIACYLDDLKWPISTKLRTELNKTFGSSNALCADQDGDGFSAINGDCDDTNAAINIAVAETAGNAVDDDCDNMTDEPGLVEADAGPAADNFTKAVQTAIPFEVTASSASPDDRDSFSFTPPPSGRVRVTLCASGDFKGWVAAQQANGNFLAADDWYSYQPKPGCTSNTFDFGKAAQGGLVVIADQAQGAYTLVASEAASLMPDFSSSVQVSTSPSGMNLEINDANGLFAELGADEIEIWISGAGIQLFRPFATSTTLELNPLTTPALNNGETYLVRVRPRANGLPLAGFSAGHQFRYTTSPASLPAVDHRFSGSWYDPEHTGEGFIVEVLDDGRAVVFWFTYHGDGSQRWLLGTGEIEANSIRVDELLDTQGGRFGAGFDPEEVVFKHAGSLSISFLDCSSALVNYSVDGNGGHQRTTRLTQVSGHGCGDGTAPPANDISGSWYDPAHSGEGFIVEQLDATQAVVFWFTYDEAGNQSWMFNRAELDNGRISMKQLLQPTGGRFGRSFDPQSVSNQEWGELTLDLDCNGGSANYTTATGGYSNGSQALVRLTRLAGSGCSGN